MSAGHKVQPTRDPQGLWYARCTCGWTTKASRHFERWQCEDEIRAHQANVQRALSALHRSPGSLKGERDWARLMMDNPAITADQRATWKVLYDGYNQRLNDEHPVIEDGLF